MKTSIEMENTARKTKLWVTLFGVVNLLLVAGTLASLLLFWKPWDPTITTAARKITITGSATVKSEPDEFQFTPSYTKDTTSEIAKLNDQIVATLKNLGVQDDQIKNNASSYGSPDIYYMDTASGKDQTTLSLTITVNDKKLAQKVQDYLLTTNPKGAITPNGSFSTAKQKELENKARGDAIKDARTKADQTASGLDTKIGKVLEVSEGSSNSGCGSAGIMCPVALGSSVSSSDEATKSKNLSIQLGKNEVTYSFTVTFALN